MNRLPILALLIGVGFIGYGQAAEEKVSAHVAVREEVIGVGMVHPYISLTQTLYFYEIPAFSAVVQSLARPSSPVDSLTFRESEHYIDMDHAPPDFAPRHVKLDYQILHLQALTLAKEWIEVVLNQETGQTAWVRRHDVAFSTWEVFLLGVFAVEVVDPLSNRLRSGPSEQDADMGMAQGLDLRPLAIQGNWMQVALLKDGEVDMGARSGWIRWRDEDHLLIHYSLLS